MKEMSKTKNKGRNLFRERKLSTKNNLHGN